jgi:hypothetical protein
LKIIGELFFYNRDNINKITSGRNLQKVPFPLWAEVLFYYPKTLKESYKEELNHDKL